MRSHSQRLHFLDLFRGAFALLMIEGHVVRALLDPSLKASFLFGIHEMIHGLPAPAFLFGSGAAFSIATLPHWNAYRQAGGRLFRRISRFAVLLLVGYALHLTYFSLHRTVAEGTADQFVALLSFDILQCIALTLLLLQSLVLILRKPQWFFWTATGLAAVVALASPLVWNFSAHLPWWFGTMLSANWGSAFPLFPCAAFQLAGAAWGYAFFQARQKGSEADFLRWSRRSSGGLVLGSLALTFFPGVLSYGDFWTTGPTFFALRVGILAFLAVSFRLAEPHLLSAGKSVVLLGQRSLMVYVVHLLLLYGSALNPDRNLLKLLGTARPLADAVAVALLLMGGMILLCWGWHRLKEIHHWPAKGVQWTLAGYLAYAFLIG